MSCNVPTARCVDDEEDAVEELEAERDPGELPEDLPMEVVEDELPADGSSAPSIRFLAVGDTGTGDTGQWAVANAMVAACSDPHRPACSFVLMLGDNFYESGLPVEDHQARRDLWYERFSGPYAKLALPFHAVLGNHDYGAGGSGVLAFFGEPGLERARMQLNGAPGAPACDASEGPAWCMPSLSYTFDVPFASKLSATFVALDTTSILFADSYDNQLAGARAALAKDARWRFVFGHHTFRSSGFHGTRGALTGLGKLYREVAEKADLILTGHDHHLEFRFPEGDERAAVMVTGAGGKIRLGALAKEDTVRAIYNGRGFFDVLVSERYLEVVMVGLEPLVEPSGADPLHCKDSKARAFADFAWCRAHGDARWTEGFCPKGDVW